MRLPLSHNVNVVSQLRRVVKMKSSVQERDNSTFQKFSGNEKITSKIWKLMLKTKKIQSEKDSIVVHLIFITFMK